MKQRFDYNGGNNPLTNATACAFLHAFNLSTREQSKGLRGVGLCVDSFCKTNGEPSVYVKIRIVERHPDGGELDKEIWDTVYFQVGDEPEYSCGNRIGAMNELATLYAPILQRIAELSREAK